ncbi:MAG: amidohydrolase [Gemmobacter sp.]
MTPDLILVNADIRTMDTACPRARGIAIGAGRILRLGSDADIRAMAGPGTQVIDLRGRLVLPGFQDAHVHLMDGGTDMVTAAALWDVQGVPALQRAVADHAAKVTLPVVIGTGWQPGLYGDHNLTAAVIDAVVSDRPAILYDNSGHCACLNSRAIELCGIGNDTPDPANGHFVRDATGQATGMLHEDAIHFAMRFLPALGPDEFLAGARAGQAHANRHGLTGIIDPRVVDHNVAAYGALAAQGALTLRVAGAALVTAKDTADSALARLTALRAAHPGPDFHIHSAKFFFDGVFENRTAAMLAPYADAGGGNAPVMFTPDQIAALFTALDAARFQIHVHVIGDAAARAALDGFETARRANGPWPGLHQLAHLQSVDPADIPRIAALGAMANIQPLWARYDPTVPDIALEMIGPDRLAQTYAFRQMLDAGAAYCLSSDFAVSTLNPFEIIEIAVTRQPLAREGSAPVFLPAERLTVAEAVQGYTVNAAAACWRGAHTGRLSPGFSADLIVLDRDIFAVPHGQIGDTQVLLTLFKGREVHRHGDFA